ncbi:MAG: vWA domain-containing protein, partial [Myxococcales bacterium]
MTFGNLPALLAAVPLLLLVHFAGRRPGPAGALRWVLAVLVPLALARPALDRGGDGLDLLILVDRSRSMPAGSDAEAEGLVRLVEARARTGERVGVISFGRQPRLEHAPVPVPASAG